MAEVLYDIEINRSANMYVARMTSKFRGLVDGRLADSSYEPAFDLDAALQEARDITGREDAGAHLHSDSGAAL